MHVDGFRFDLASVTGRDARELLPTPALERIAEDRVLRCEDVARRGTPPVHTSGQFFGAALAEWNGGTR